MPAAPAQGPSRSRVRTIPWAWVLPAVLIATLAVRVPGLAYQPDWRDQPNEIAYANHAIDWVATGGSHWPPGPSPAYTAMLAVIARGLELSGATQFGVNVPTNQPVDEVKLEYDRHELLIVARALNLAFALAGVLMTVLSIRLLVGTEAAMLVAPLLALSLADVRQVQFASPLLPALCATATCCYCAVRFAIGGRSLWIAGAIVSGISASLLTLPLAVGLLAPVAAWRLRANIDVIHLDRRGLSTPVGKLELLGIVMFGALWIAHHHGEFRQGLAAALQYDLIPDPWSMGALLIYPAGLFQSLGPVAIALALLGLGLSIRSAAPALQIFGSVAVGWCFVLLIHGNYGVALQLPLEPVLAMSAAYAFAWARGHLSLLRSRGAFVAVLMAILVVPAAHVALLNDLSRQPDTRDQAWDWVQAATPQRTHVRAMPEVLPQASLARGREAAIRASTIPATEIIVQATPLGCGEVIAVASDADAGLGEGGSAVTREARHYLRTHGDLIASFSPLRIDATTPHTREDIARPFWNLQQARQPGPSIELFAVQAACNERPPLAETWDTLTSRKSGSGGALQLMTDPRFSTTPSASLSGAPELPFPIYAAAVGKFLPSEDVALLASLADEDVPEEGREVRQTLRISRLARGLPPQPLLVDRESLAGRAAHGGLAALDVNGDGVDELAVFVRENTADYRVAEHVEIYALGTRLTRVARWPISSYRGERTLGIFTSPTDLETPMGSLALATSIGTEIRIRLLHWSSEAQTFQPLEGRRAHLRLPNREAASAAALALGDMDGDGRNELALLNTRRSRTELYKIPHGQPGVASEPTRWDDRAAIAESNIITAVASSGWWDAPRTQPDLVILETLVNRSTLVGYQQRTGAGMGIALTQAQVLDLPPRNEPNALSIGRFSDGSSERLLLLVRREGRQQYLDAWPVNERGQIVGGRQNVDKWRAERTDQVLDNGIAAADIDGDGRDEVILARQRGSDQELIVYALDSGRELALRPIGSGPRRLPRDERFLAMSALPSMDGRRDSLAILGSYGSDRHIVILEAEPSGWSAGRVVSQTPLDARITAVAAGSSSQFGRAPLLALGRESSLAKFITPLSVNSDGVQPRESFPWYVLDERAVLWAGWR